MKLDLLNPAKSLNKAYFKQSLKREQIVKVQDHASIAML